MPIPLEGWPFPGLRTAVAPQSRCPMASSLHSWWFYTASPESARARVRVCSITVAGFPAGGKDWAVTASLPRRLIASLGPFLGLGVSYRPTDGFINAGLPEVSSASSGIGALPLLTALSVNSSVGAGASIEIVCDMSFK